MRAEVERHIEGIERLLANSSAPPTGLIGVLLDPPIADPLSWAIEARKIYGERLQIYGFWAYENPQACILGNLRERHDFAVLDERWLIDGWITKFYSDEGAGLVDLSDTADIARSSGLYGDRATWERDPDIEHRADLMIRTPSPDSEPEADVFPGAIRA